MDRMPGQGLHGQWGNEFAGSLGHHHPHLSTHILQATNQIGGFIGGNPARDSQKDAFVHQTMHARTLIG